MRLRTSTSGLSRHENRSSLSLQNTATFWKCPDLSSSYTVMQNWKLMLSAECKLIWPVSYTTNIKLLSVEKASYMIGKLPTVDAAETAEKSYVLNSCT